MVCLKSILTYAIVYSYTLWYCLKFSFLIFVLFVTKSSTKFWKVKRRSTPPACMTDPTLSRHQTAS